VANSSESMVMFNSELLVEDITVEVLLIPSNSEFKMAEINVKLIGVSEGEEAFVIIELKLRDKFESVLENKGSDDPKED
jgi:hypothetical protein